MPAVVFVAQGRGKPIRQEEASGSIAPCKLTVRKGNPDKLQGRRLAIAQAIAHAWCSDDASDSGSIGANLGGIASDPFSSLESSRAKPTKFDIARYIDSDSNMG